MLRMVSGGQRLTGYFFFASLGLRKQKTVPL